MNDFDQAARFQVKRHPHEHFAWLFPRATRTMRWSRWLDSQSAPRPGEDDRRCDTIAELVHREGLTHPRAAVVELFTNPDPEALDRTGEYLWRFRRELRHGPHERDKYPLVAALIFLTGRCAERELFADLPDESDVGQFFQPRVVELAEQDGVAFLDAIQHNRLPPALLAWTVLMKGAQSKQAAERWVELAARLSETDRRLAASVALTLSDLTDCRRQWQPVLEEFLMNESTFLREIRTETRLIQGRDWLNRFLRSKLSGDALERALTLVDKQEDPTTLSRWFDLVLTLSPEELLHELAK